jgi:hypothetical protein
MRSGDAVSLCTVHPVRDVAMLLTVLLQHLRDDHWHQACCVFSKTQLSFYCTPTCMYTIQLQLYRGQQVDHSVNIRYCKLLCMREKHTLLLHSKLSVCQLTNVLVASALIFRSCD